MKETTLWLVLTLVAGGCAAAGRVLDNLTAPGGAGDPSALEQNIPPLITAATEGTDLEKYGIGGIAAGLLGWFGAWWRGRGSDKRKRGEQWSEITTLKAELERLRAREAESKKG